MTTFTIKRETGGDLTADYATGLYDLTRGDSVSITFRFPNETDFLELQQTADFGGQYTINETLDSTQTYAERLPAGADVDSLVLGIEPSAELQSENVSGIWAIVDGGTDERNPTLNEYRYTVDLTVLADFDEYTSVTDVESDLKTN